jgi:hypothetical protein
LNPVTLGAWWSRSQWQTPPRLDLFVERFPRAASLLVNADRGDGSSDEAESDNQQVGPPRHGISDLLSESLEASAVLLLPEDLCVVRGGDRTGDAGKNRKGDKR